jgi:transcriptional regulator with XRE-family HTH domain
MEKDKKTRILDTYFGNFAERLTSLRKRANLSREEMANYLGMNSTAYGYYETGTRKPPLDKIILLSQYFNTSIDDLLGYDPGRKGKYIRIVEDAGISVEIKDNDIILCNNDPFIKQYAYFDENEFVNMVSDVLEELHKQSRPALYDKIYKKMLEKLAIYRDEWIKDSNKLQARYPKLFQPQRDNDNS